ncbi:MAG: FtsQ-type POTRA domain-containing protein [Alphaproteobacteria bacterium]|nr:FtsQ-type POTRA domain-containing protein [Alphaproteobacteria bacterium]
MPKMSSRRGGSSSARPARKRKAAPKKAAKRQGGASSVFERIGSTLEEYAFASIAGAIVIVAVGGVIFWAGGYGAVAAKAADQASRGLARSAGLRVERITLRGAHDLSHAELLGAIGGAMDASIVHLDLEALREKVEALGWVRWASVGRLYPNTLHISVRERAPIAVWQVAGAVRLIDHEGAVIREIGAHEYAHLPMIVGDGAAVAAADVLAALEPRPDLASTIAAIVRVGERRWNLRLRNGAKILLPEDGVEDSIDLVWRMHEKEEILDQPLEYIDLRDGKRVIVRRKAEADP